MTESQKQFEEWARKEGLHVNFIACDCFYDVRATETAWQAWQASRAAIVVKLPDWDCYDTPRQALEACEDRLSDTGVRYE